MQREASALSGAGERYLRAKRDRFDGIGERLNPGLIARPMRDAQQRLTALGDLLESLSFRRVLERGYAVVRDAAGQPVTAAAGLAAGDAVSIEFTDGAVGAQVNGASGPARPAPRARQTSKPQADKKADKPETPNTGGRQGRLL